MFQRRVRHDLDSQIIVKLTLKLRSTAVVFWILVSILSMMQRRPVRTLLGT
jgi:hypothetical protein